MRSNSIFAEACSVALTFFAGLVMGTIVNNQIKPNLRADLIGFADR